MCGLCGVLSTTLNALEVEAFQDLMTISTLRGDFGAGIVAVPTNFKNNIQILRHEYNTAAELAHSGEFSKINKGKSFSMLMGHARSPTSGGFELEDCHPHVVGDIIGMHNGTLTKVGGQTVGEKDNDSRMLFQSISTIGVDDTLKNTVGSYSITFIDKKLGTLYFIRNKDRPLFWAKPENVSTIYWASEADFLKVVLNRKYTHGKIHIFCSLPDLLTLFRIRPTQESGYFDKREIKQIPPTSVPRIQAPYLLPAPSIGHNSEQKPETTYLTKDGNYVTFFELKLLLQNGCAYCNRAHTMIDYAKKQIIWTGAEEYVCRECAEYDQFAKDYILSNGIIV